MHLRIFTGFLWRLKKSLNPLSFVDLFNIFVYTQPYIWLLLYRSKIKLSLKVFWAISGVVLALVAVTGWSIGHYINNILIGYIAMVLGVTYFYREMGSTKAVCLGFLLVFINSYFWEIPIHFADLLESHNFGLQIIQGLHIVPLPLLIYVAGNDFTYPKRSRLIDLILISFIATFGVTWVRFTFIRHFDELNYLLQHINRWFCLGVLTKIFNVTKTMDK